MPPLEITPNGVSEARKAPRKRGSPRLWQAAPVEVSDIIREITNSALEKYSPNLVKIEINVTNIRVEGDMVSKPRNNVARDTYTARVEGSSEVAIAQGARAKSSIKSRDRIAVHDLKTLATELDQLRVAMRAEAHDVEHDEAVAAVGQAQKAAEKGDEKTVMGRLKGAGQWALGIAEKLALTAASKAIEDAIQP